MKNTDKNSIKKIVFAFILLFVSTVVSIGINYKNTGVFKIESRKLPIYCVESKEKKVAITFDVSWGNDNTDKLLDILDKYNVKATFFIVGGWIDQNEDKVMEIKKRGHEIGNHSNKHPDMTKLSSDGIIQDIDACDAKLMKITGEDTKLFRCPEGAYNNIVIDSVARTNHYCIQWDVDSIDWKENGADIEYNRVMKGVKPGSILLFHNNARYTPETLPKIIENLKGQGYSFVKAGDLIYKENYKIDLSGRQIQK